MLHVCVGYIHIKTSSVRKQQEHAQQELLVHQEVAQPLKSLSKVACMPAVAAAAAAKQDQT